MTHEMITFSFSHKVISEKEYKPLHDKYGKDRCCQWEVMDREKLAIQEAIAIATIIKEYSGIRRISQILPVKNWVKSHVLSERRESKCVKWSSNVEIFEYKMATMSLSVRHCQATHCVCVDKQGLIDLATAKLPIS
mmetsp:Transcript_8011/g.12374  ORF Transcript_8011/g.12374 Transcript_8011/m.12374 type:complete len:136 (+) Transcript_8011:35-442(+)